MITISSYPGGLATIRKKLEAERVPGQPLDVKQREFTRRALVDANAHRGLIVHRVLEVYETPEIQDQIVRHVQTTRNVLRHVVDALSIAYNTAPSRKIRGASEEQAKAFSDAYRDAVVDERLEQASRVCTHSNVAHVLVRWETDGPRLLVLGPHQCDVILSPDGRDDRPAIMVYATQSMGAAWVIVDSERWVWVDENWRVMLQEEHRLGVVPWVEWRSRAPVSDYWDAALGHDLAECTIDVERMAAHMRFVRTHRSQKALVFTMSEQDALPPAQSVNGESVMLQGSARMGLGVVDHEVAPENFLRDISEAVRSTYAAHGIRSTGETTLVDPDEADRLGKRRAQQLGYYARAELELARRVARLISVHGGVKIDDDLVREGFRVRFAPYVPADEPQAQVATAKEQQRMGASDPVAFFLTMHPELTGAQAWEEIEESVEITAKFTDMVTTRGLALGDGGTLQTLQQAAGRIGGQTSGAVRREARDDERDDDPTQ